MSRAGWPKALRGWWLCGMDGVLDVLVESGLDLAGTVFSAWIHVLEDLLEGGVFSSRIPICLVAIYTCQPRSPGKPSQRRT